MSHGHTRADHEPVRVVRIIARLNIGGPAIQAITLTERLLERGYGTVLVRGAEEPDEGSMDHFASELGVLPVLVPSLRRNPGWRDALALAALVRILRHERPDLVHTHAAKGGTLGRVAAVLAFPRRHRRPILVHTYHGHSLTGYFSSRTANTYRRIEQVLASHTDCLVAVSEEVKSDLVALGVAAADRFTVIPLGFDLSPFLVDGGARMSARVQLRTELGIPAGARLVTLIARLVPIKRVDRFLRLARALSDIPEIRFLIVGDGELRDTLEESPEARSLSDKLIWAGFRRDMPAVCVASDLIVQTSDNEGTPVSLIEAQAAAVPVVSTRVGGTPSTLSDDELLADREDEQQLADVARRILLDPELAREHAENGRRRVLAAFGLDRLVDDVDSLYRALLESR